MAAVTVGSSIFFFFPAKNHSCFCNTHHTVNIPALTALFLCHLGRCFLKHVCVTTAVLVPADEFQQECVSLHVCICMCAWQTRQLKMRYGQWDGSESAGCRWVLYYCVSRNIQNSSALSRYLPFTLSLLHHSATGTPSQLPVVLTGTLAASFHIGQLGKLLLKL